MISLIIQREYFFRIRKKSFWVMTLLMPVLFTALVFVPMWLASFQEPETRTIVVSDRTGKYAGLFQSSETCSYIPAEGTMADYRTSDDKEITAFLDITATLSEHPGAATLYSFRQLPQPLVHEVERILSEAVRNEKLEALRIPDIQQVISATQETYNVQTVKWNEDGETEENSSALASVVGMVTTLVIYMFIMVYGSMVMQGVMEEKTNRIVEVMISSVKPFDLMMGKIIGIGLIGLTQALFWGIFTTILIGLGKFAFGGESLSGQEVGNLSLSLLGSLPWIKLGISFLLYFIGGYIFYGALFAAIGSALEQAEDAQQFMSPMMILMIFSLYAGIYGAENPDGPLAFWASMIPFSSPMVMMMRLSFDVPAWQLLVSLAILGTSAVGTVWLSARIYRVGILMYGKKPSLKEIWRWVRY